ncbi:MAG: hypothetical protein JNM63_12355 [Spirochaetia bacterium]|nr:hypothetical protein [Spirochaetia bacterium]
MKLDKAELHQLVKTFQLTRGEAVREKILRQVSDYMFHFPAFMFGKRDPDLQSEFYLAALERFDAYLARFDEKAASFNHYLSICLRNLFLNLVMRRREIQTRSLDAPMCASSDEVLTLGDTVLRYEDKNFTEGQGEDEEVQNLRRLFDSMKSDESYLLARLYHFDLFDDSDFLRLRRHTGKSMGECAAFVEEIMEFIRIRKERRTALEHRLTRLYQKILHAQKELDQARQMGEEEELIRKMASLRQKQDDYLAEYQKVRIHPAPKLLAGFFGIPETRVINQLSYFRLSAAKRLEKAALEAASGQYAP